VPRVLSGSLAITIARVDAAAGTRIDCLRGLLWVTEAGGDDDIVLNAGESYPIARAGIAVVQGLREEALVALRAPAERHGESLLATWLAWLWGHGAAREVPR
jgi:hypothetical protein